MITVIQQRKKLKEEDMKSRKIKSGFNPREKFDFQNVPNHFESVTEDSIKDIKNYCSVMVGKKFHGEYKPSALKEMLQMISGEFKPAYVQLEGDRITRLQNLHNAQRAGIAEMKLLVGELKLQLNKQRIAFDDLRESSEKLNIRKPDDSLCYSADLYKKYNDILNKIGE